MHSSTHDDSLARGYTLIEMLVVLAIISILAIAGVSIMVPRSPRSVRAGLYNVKEILQEARQAAQARGTYVRLDFSWDGKQLARIKGYACDSTGATLKNADKTPVLALDTSLDRSLFRSIKLVSAVSGLPNDSIQAVPAAISFGFGSTSEGWNHPILGSNTLAFSPNGSLVKFDSGTGSATTISALDGGCWVGVVGLSINSKGYPYGAVLVSPGGQILAFYKPDSAPNEGTTLDAEFRWQRLE